MSFRSAAFHRLVKSLQQHGRTCTVVEQSCGGLIQASILAQPGASAVFLGGTVAYNTQRCLPLLLNDSALHKSLLQTRPAIMTTTDHADGITQEAYMASKRAWTAAAAVAYCRALGTDYAMAESGATGPTFRPRDMTTGCGVIAIAGRNTNGEVQVLDQTTIPSLHANRHENMRMFANAAAELCTKVLAADTASLYDTSTQSTITTTPTLDRCTLLRGNVAHLRSMETKARYIVIVGGSQVLARSATEPAILSYDQAQRLQEGFPDKVQQSFLGRMTARDEDKDTPSTSYYFSLGMVDSNVEEINAVLQNCASTAAAEHHHDMTFSLLPTRTSAPLFSPAHNQIALYATALSQWHARSHFCSLCGHATAVLDGGSRRACTACSSSTWPRQDPSMIAAILSRDGDRILLARSPRHPPRVHTFRQGGRDFGTSGGP